MDLAEFMGASKTFVSFVGGLSYFSLGNVLFISVKRSSRLPLVRAPPWLAGFAIINGLYIWSEMVTFIKGYENLAYNNWIYIALHLGMAGISFSLLFQFGVELVCEMTPRWKALRFIPLNMFGVWLAISAMSGLDLGLGNIHDNGIALSKYLLCFPGSVITSQGFLRQYREIRSRDFGGASRYLPAIAVGFFANAIFCGLLPPKAAFWPASAVNAEYFEMLFGSSPSTLSALVSIAITTSMLLWVQELDKEESSLLTKREKELEFLDRIFDEINRSLDLRKAMTVILDDVLRLLSCRAGAVFIRRPDADELSLEACRGLSWKYMADQSKQPERMGIGLIGSTVENGSALFGRTAHCEDIRRLIASPSIYEFFGIVPFVGKESNLGAILVASTLGREFSEGDMHLLRTIGNQLGILLENALLKEEQNTARILQKSLLAQPPNISALDIGYYYKPASAGLMIGGDFYDFVPLSDGKLAVVIGDVSGKGLDAAVLTSRARESIRAFLVDGESPSDALSRANKALARAGDFGQFVTALIVVWHPGGMLSYASAGHPPSIFCSSEFRFLAEAQGLPLGAFEEARYEEAADLFASPGEFLVLYTDGLTEARRGRILFGEKRLSSIIRNIKGRQAKEIASEIAKAALEFSEQKLKDDLAVVVLRNIVGGS